VSLSLPRVGLKRLAATAALCTTATSLWIAAPAYLPFADVSAKLVAAGVVVPWGVGWVTLLLMERRIADDLSPADEPAAERDQVGAR